MRVVWLVLAGLISSGCLAVTALSSIARTPVKSVAVLAISDTTEASAIAKLHSEGLTVVVIHVRSHMRRAGLVVAQSPSPGMRVGLGAAVTIAVSTGP